ncbi:MAG: protein kinase [Gemmatimonadota bacterium]|nr:protein kinase [Gemmatimonadota bacterium]
MRNMSGLEGLLAGRTLVGRYRIEEVIGRGGFAAVYRATDERLGRTVAVKVITIAASNDATREQLRERLQREARAVASLPQHPNVVTVSDVGTDAETGLDFLVMDLLQGEDLASYLDRVGKPPQDLALRILREAACGVGVGHQAGIIHRDVKPGNIFLVQNNGSEPPQVRVLDFGIAQTAAEGDTLTRLTQQGGAPLSPAYASPEQLRGERDLTPASDVFSLGVMGYQLLTGERPFEGERTPENSAGWDPARRIREHSPSVASAVVTAIRRALSADPKERFRDANAFVEALGSAAPQQDRRTASVPPAVATPPVTTPEAAALPQWKRSVPEDDDRTMVAPPPPPVAARPPVRASAPPPDFDEPRGFPGWLAGVLVLAALALGGWWLLGRDRQPDQGLEPIATPEEQLPQAPVVTSPVQDPDVFQQDPVAGAPAVPPASQLPEATPPPVNVPSTPPVAVPVPLPEQRPPVPLPREPIRRDTIRPDTLPGVPVLPDPPPDTLPPLPPPPPPTG